MKLQIERRILHGALQATARAVGKSSLPILANVHLEAIASKRLRLHATDLELSMERWVDAEVQEAGSCTLPAKLLCDLVASLPEGNVTIKTDAQDAGTITCGKSRTRICGLPAAEYPPAPTIEEGLCFQIAENRLRSLLRCVHSAIALDDLKPVLTGVLFHVQGEILRLVATDTHQLRSTTAPISSTDGDGQHIIPGRAVRELLHLTSDTSAEPVLCQFGPNQAQFEVGRTTLTTRVIEGKFPGWERVVPTNREFKLTLDATDLRQAVKRAAIVATEDFCKVTLDAEEATLAVSAGNGIVGSCQEELEYALEGKPVKFLLNANYLLQSLDAVGGEVVTIEGTKPLSPMVIRAVGDETKFALLMPMN